MMRLVLVDMMRWSGCQNPNAENLVVLKAAFADLDLDVDLDARPRKVLGMDNDVAIADGIQPVLYTHSPKQALSTEDTKAARPTILWMPVPSPIAYQNYGPSTSRDTCGLESGNSSARIPTRRSERRDISRVLKSNLGPAQFEGSSLFDLKNTFLNRC